MVYTPHTNHALPAALARHVPAELPDTTTLATFATTRLERVKHERPWALADFRSNTKRVLEYLGAVPVVAITVAVMVGFVRLLQELRLAAATIRKVLATARALLEDARVAGLIARNPADIPRGELPARRVRDELERAKDIFTVEEIGRLLLDERIPLERRALYALLLLAGVRFGEAAALMWCDLDTSIGPFPDIQIRRSWNAKSRLVRPSTKSGVSRHVPAHPVLVRILDQLHRSYAAIYGRPADRYDLIVPRRTRVGEVQPLLPTITLRRFHADLDLLGIRRRPLHRCRATFDTQLRRAGAPRPVVRALTHPPKISEPFGDLYDLYDLYDWPERCAAVALFPDVTKESDR